MNIVLPWLVVLALGVTLVAVVYVTIKDRKASKNEIKRLSADLEAQKRISEDLCHYVEEVVKIHGDKEQVAEKIEKAENDEEVLAIIAGLVKSNNDRVRK